MSLSPTDIIIQEATVVKEGHALLSTSNLATLNVQFSVGNIASSASAECRLSSEGYRNQGSGSALGMTLGAETALRCAQSLLSQRS